MCNQRVGGHSFYLAGCKCEYLNANNRQQYFFHCKSDVDYNLMLPMLNAIVFITLVFNR